MMSWENVLKRQLWQCKDPNKGEAINCGRVRAVPYNQSVMWLSSRPGHKACEDWTSAFSQSLYLMTVRLRLRRCRWWEGTKISRNYCSHWIFAASCTSFTRYSQILFIILLANKCDYSLWSETVWLYYMAWCRWQCRTHIRAAILAMGELLPVPQLFH